MGMLFRREPRLEKEAPSKLLAIRSVKRCRIVQFKEVSSESPVLDKGTAFYP